MSYKVFAAVILFSGVVFIASCDRAHGARDSAVCGYSFSFPSETERVEAVATRVEDLERATAVGDAFFFAEGASLTAVVPTPETGCDDASLPESIGFFGSQPEAAMPSPDALDPMEFSSLQTRAIEALLNSADAQRCVLMGTGGQGIEDRFSAVRVHQLPYLGGAVARAEILNDVVYVGIAQECSGALPVVRALERAFHPVQSEWRVCEQSSFSACGYAITNSPSRGRWN